MTPKLSKKHINLPMFSKLGVKLATQVLSHSVAAGISTHVSFGALPDEAMETDMFVEKMDQLFNVFNSLSLKSSKKMGHAISYESTHFEFLDDVKTMLKSIKIKSRLCGKLIFCYQGKGWTWRST